MEIYTDRVAGPHGEIDVIEAVSAVSTAGR